MENKKKMMQMSEYSDMCQVLYPICPICKKPVLNEANARMGLCGPWHITRWFVAKNVAIHVECVTNLYLRYRGLTTPSAKENHGIILPR